MIKICTASAGAGKTHKLTSEYISLLLKDTNAYKHILAVTFTNKATEEMKQRILEELYNLSVKGRKSEHLDVIKKSTLLDEDKIREESKRFLSTSCMTTHHFL
jgi:ATP-dependent exoDNAse (exonuclease V) beta subunit